MVTQSAGAASPWFWQALIDDYDLYAAPLRKGFTCSVGAHARRRAVPRVRAHTRSLPRYYEFASVATFVAEVPWNTRRWQPVAASLFDPAGGGDVGCPARAMGLGGFSVGGYTTDVAVVWLQNTNHTWRHLNETGTSTVGTCDAAVMRVLGLTSGAYLARWFDSVTGKWLPGTGHAAPSSPLTGAPAQHRSKASMHGTPGWAAGFTSVPAGAGSAVVHCDESLCNVPTPAFSQDVALLLHLAPSAN